MAVNWGLANPGGGFDALESLQAIGNQAAQRQQMQQRDYGFQQQRQQDQARPQIQQQAAAGDFAGAAAQAFSLGDYDALKYVGGLEAAKHAQLAGEADTIGRLATSLIGLPQEQRQAAFAAVAPQLRQAGFDDGELAAVQLDDGALQAYIKLATDTKTALSSYAKSQEPTVLADGSQLYQGDKMIAENGRDAKWQFDSESGSWLQEPGTGGTPVAQPTGGGVGPAQQQMAAHLSSAGLPAPVVAGFMGNFDAEGGYTGAQGDGGSAGGVAQWRGERRANFQRVIGKDPTTANMQEQAAFVKWEMDNPQAAGMTVAQRDAILNARSPEEAADLIDRHYERSSGEHRERRVSAARQFAGGARPQSGVVNVRPPKSKQRDAPSGYEWLPDGSQRPIRGGPADPATATNRNVQSNRKAEADFRKEFEGRKEVQAFRSARTQFNALRDTALNPRATAQDDIAVIFQFMKTLDPTSTVREGEFATAQNAGGIPDTIRNAFNKAQNGERLNPEQRKNMAKTAYRSYRSFRDAYNSAATEFRGYASDNGINPDRVARTYTPDKPPAKADRMSQFKIVKVR